MPSGGPPHVAVVGAGIIGSSIAFNLAKKGCKVTVLESGPRAAEGATAKSWAWLNANKKAPAQYKGLNKAGMEEWRHINGSKLGADQLAEFPGTIYLGDERESDEAYPSTKVDKATVKRLDPEIANDLAAAGGRFYDQEGYGYAATAAKVFLEEVRDRGGTICYSEEVTGFSSADGCVTGVTTNRGQHQPDIVILAAGLNTPILASKLGAAVPLANKPGTLTILTQPMPHFLNHIVVTEEAFIMQRRDGEVMISFFKAAVNHSPIERQDQPAESPDDGIAGRVKHSAEELQAGHQEEAFELLNESDEIAEQEIARAAKIIPALEYASLSSFSVAKYPYPADAHPILGWLPDIKNVYVAVTHSGATLGPLLGRLISEEILGRKQDQLEAYRPNRDFSDQSCLY